MLFEVSQTEQYTLLKMSTNKLDTEIAPDLKSQIIVLTGEPAIRPLIFDLSEVKFADSRGLSALLLAYRMYRDAGVNMILCNIGERVQKLIEISQLNHTFTIAKSLDEALSLLED